MKYLYSLLLLCLLSGCANTEYVGKNYTPTTHVDLFMSTAEIPRFYSVMGKAQTEATEYMSYADMQQQLMRDAMAKGADAIVITGMQTINVGSSSYTSGQAKKSDPEYYLTESGKLKTRRKSGSNSYTEASTSTQIRDHVLSADLLKYTN